MCHDAHSRDVPTLMPRLDHRHGDLVVCARLPAPVVRVHRKTTTLEIFVSLSNIPPHLGTLPGGNKILFPDSARNWGALPYLAKSRGFGLPLVADGSSKPSISDFHQTKWGRKSTFVHEAFHTWQSSMVMGALMELENNDSRHRCLCSSCHLPPTVMSSF